MTKHELLDKLSAAREAAERLPEDVNILCVDIDPDFLGGTVIGLNNLTAPDIADVAAALGTEVQTGPYGAGQERYFMLGTVKVSQLVDEEANHAQTL